MVKIYSKAKDGQKILSKHFKVYEFACPASDFIYIDEKLIGLLEAVYSAALDRGYQVTAIDINSGYRTVEYDKSPEVGGYGGGPHTRGEAADFKVRVKGRGNNIQKRGDRYYIDAKIICCILQDIGCNGIGYIGGVAAHCDTRTLRWWGDEKTHNDDVTNWYAYFNIPQKTEEKDSVSISYRVYTAKRKWLPFVIDTKDYAGIHKQAIQGLQATVSRGHVEYRAHIRDRWLPWVKDTQDFAGIIGKDIDGIQMRLVDLPGYSIMYRVSTIGSNYYSWVKNYGDGIDGYAGIFGRPIDRIQCKVVKK